MMAMAEAEIHCKIRSSVSGREVQNMRKPTHMFGLPMVLSGLDSPYILPTSGENSAEWRIGSGHSSRSWNTSLTPRRQQKSKKPKLLPSRRRQIPKQLANDFCWIDRLTGPLVLWVLHCRHNKAFMVIVSASILTWRIGKSSLNSHVKIGKFWFHYNVLMASIFMFALLKGKTMPADSYLCILIP